MCKLKLLAGAALLAASAASTANADQVINDDLIVTFSACIGNDCVNGENFGFDTLRLKENNLRIHFNDTSNSASFPTRDWRIVANDSTNGGSEYLAIEDADAGTQPFRVDAGAGNNALRVENGGFVGFGTSNPVVNLHVVEGNTPTLRLEQDGSSGFTPQVYDVAANEANFFIRDVTNGSALFFRAQPGAPENSIYIANDGDVGLGTNSPQGDFHVASSGQNDAQITLGQSGSLPVNWQFTNNENTGRLVIGAAGQNIPFKMSHTSVQNLLRVGIVNNTTVDINGDLQVTGNLTIDGQCSEVDGACADFVFMEGYELLSIDQLADFIEEHKHLPTFPSAAQIAEQGFNVATFSGDLLETVEGLTLYTIQQQDQIRALEARLEQIEAPAN